MKLTIEIASVPDRDEAVAEIWHDNEMIAEVRRCQGHKHEIEMYPKKAGGSWLLDFNELHEALLEARRRLG